MNTSSRI